MSSLTQEHLDALDEAIASGVTKVTHNGRSVDYDTMQNLIARRNYVAGMIDRAAQSARVRFHGFSKGHG